MAQMERAYKEIGAQNIFSDPIYIANDSKVTLTLGGTFVGTVTLQVKTIREGSSWIDVDTQTGTGRWNLDSGGDMWRFGVKTGEYTSGTVEGTIQGKMV